MKYLLYAICLIVFFFRFFPAAAQDDIMMLEVLKSDALRRPPVRFPHLTHEEKISCQRCHHDYDEFGVIEEAEELTCTPCHQIKSSDNLFSLRKALHLQCKGCHERATVKGYTRGPVMCGQCHQRQS